MRSMPWANKRGLSGVPGPTRVTGASLSLRAKSVSSPALTKVEAVIINSPQAGTTCGAASAGMSPGPGACSRTRAPGSFASSLGKRPTTTVAPGPPQPIGAKPSSSSPASATWLRPALMAATPTARARGLWAWAQAAR